ncbi:transmembrane protein 272-like [Mixophyes fleayi]|uniref:transmembrane protein 272-like n=1 Tax=Mixophyes fleayi TaxID=3061075 RepID=UPI003F4DEB07
MAGGDATEKLSERCCNCKFLVELIFALIWTAICIALIVVGALNINNCNQEPNIPIFMIVAGAFGLAYWIFLPFDCCLPTVRKVFNILVALFLFAWFIAGSVWVFRIYPTQNRACDNGMYLFAFSILIIFYLFIGLGIIGSLIACCCCENSCFTGFFKCFELCNCLKCCKSIQCSSCLKSCICCKCSQCSVEKA